jgi:hypothetical protein
MGPAAQVVSLDVVLAASAGLVLCAALAGFLAVRAARRRRAALDVELARSRQEVETLSRKVAELSDDVVRARRAADQDREYVITSLTGEGRTAEPLEPQRLLPAPHRVQVGRVLQDQLVEALARQPRGSALRDHAVQLVVRTVATGHGLRRALSPDVLDRAAAEAHVARRRSRRERRRQVRLARRLVRAESLAERSTSTSSREVA